MYDKTHYNIVISLQLIKKKIKKNWLCGSLPSYEFFFDDPSQ